jgi:hypothetical protein
VCPWAIPEEFFTAEKRGERRKKKAKMVSVAGGSSKRKTKAAILAALQREPPILECGKNCRFGFCFFASSDDRRSGPPLPTALPYQSRRPAT